MSTTWDSGFEDTPADSTGFNDGPGYITEAKTSIRERVDKEHEFLLIAAGQARNGLHEDSACAYDSATAPTERGDTGVGLGSSDGGSLWVDSDNNFIYGWDGANWNHLSGSYLEYEDAAIPVGNAANNIPRTNGVLCSTLNTEKIRGIQLSGPGAGTMGGAAVAAGVHWVIPAGLLMILATGTPLFEMKNDSGIWESHSTFRGGLFISDGASYRLYSGAAFSVYYRKYA